jgi:hypothetical protein
VRDAAATAAASGVSRTIENGGQDVLAAAIVIIG